MNRSDNETLVKDFLNLWQKQFSHMSRDGDSLSKGMEAFTNMQQAYTNLMGEKAGTKNAKSAATSDILRNIGNEFVRLARSYEELEERVARLESGAGTRRAAPAKKTPAKKNTRVGKRTPKADK